MQIYRSVFSLVYHHPIHYPAIDFISTFIVCVNYSLFMAAAPQGNTNTNFANFDAFGNTAIPSHLSTSPPSKSFSSGTTPPHHCLPSFHPVHIHSSSPQYFSHSFPTHCVHWESLSSVKNFPQIIKLVTTPMLLVTFYKMRYTLMLNICLSLMLDF